MCPTPDLDVAAICFYGFLLDVEAAGIVVSAMLRVVDVISCLLVTLFVDLIVVIL